MSRPSQEFHLIVDHLSQLESDGELAVDEAKPQRLIVPAGVSYLLISSGQAPRLLNEADVDEAENAFLLEPIQSQQQPHLVLITQAGKDIRVNGQVAPHLALLRERDQVQFDDDIVLHVALFSRPSIVDVPDEHVGKECPVCRVPFTAGIRVFVCPACSRAIHLQGDEEPELTRLECALAVTECPVCQTTIEMTEGYRYEPELYRV